MGGMMGKLLVFAILFSLVSLSCLAELTADAEIVEQSIYPDQSARFTITINNPDKIEKILTVYSTEAEWYAETDPSIIRVGKESSLDLKLKLMPNAWAQFGAQAVEVYIDSSAGDSISMQVPVYLKRYGREHKDFEPSVELKVTFPATIDPRGPIPLEIYMRNRNGLSMESLDIYVMSRHFSDHKTVKLDSVAERKESLTLYLDSLTPPSTEDLTVKLMYNNKTVNEEAIEYSVLGFSNISTREDTIEELFKKVVEYNVKNIGNIENKETYRIKTSFLRSIFTKTMPKAGMAKEGKEPYLEWQLGLAPMAETKLVVTENYRPVIYGVLIALIMVMIYFLYRSPVVVKKDVIVTGSDPHGISKMKVLIHIRNRSQDLVEHIKVTDMIPSIADMIQEENLGSLAPEKVVRHDKKGTIIKWELEALEPFEERIITYR
ncbi:MAG: hypothetical protein HGA85_03045, partial [Nanoarchaeota archaeon]|nr:hypothetical protein [Nanoarchaeota archaeon]